MGLRPTTSADVGKMFTKFKRIDHLIEQRLRYVGEQFIQDARNSGDYTDRTGNLRSSIGFIILKDGRVIQEAFEKAGKGTDQATGVKAGQDYSKQVAQAFPRNYVLIVVAGAEYASAVESKGKDVLTGSSEKAKQALSKALQRIADNIK
jgi:hypothetical protein